MFIDPDSDSPADTDRMLVDPDKLERLKSSLEDEVDVIQEWLYANLEPLTKIDSPGSDPCSRDTMQIMSQNGQAAIDKARAYVARLRMVAEKLHESAVAYGVTEEHNAAGLRRGPR